MSDKLEQLMKAVRQETLRPDEKIHLEQEVKAFVAAHPLTPAPNATSSLPAQSLALPKLLVGLMAVVAVAVLFSRVSVSPKDENDRSSADSTGSTELPSETPVLPTNTRLPEANEPSNSVTPTGPKQTGTSSVDNETFSGATSTHPAPVPKPSGPTPSGQADLPSK